MYGSLGTSCKSSEFGELRQTAAETIADVVVGMIADVVVEMVVEISKTQLIIYGFTSTHLMEQSDLLVRRIREGTVIDHIDEGRGLQVLEAIGINGRDGSLITIALNVPSGKFRKKDIIKVENKFLKDDETNKLAVIAPRATINIIKGYKLVEKRRAALPNEIDRIFRCSNPDCITNSTEHIESVMDVVDKEGCVLRCRYCSRVLDVSQLEYN